MVVGIDAGGTSCRVVLADDAGAPLWEMHGAADASGSPAMLDRALVEALHRAASREPIRGVCAGITKITRGGVRERWEQHLQQAFAQSLIDVVPDYVIAFQGATGGVGLSVVAGTGSVAYGEDRQGNQVRVGGRGWEYGDEGSGAWLTAEAIRRTLRAQDGLDMSSPLTQAVCEFLGNDDPAILAEEARRHAETMGRGFLVPLLLEQAREGDRESRNLFVGAAGALALLVKAAGQKLNLRAEAAIPVATVGGLWSAGDLLLAPFRQNVQQMLPRAVVRAPQASPVLGAVERALLHLVPQRPALPVLRR